MSDPVKAIACSLRRHCAPLATVRIDHSESRTWQSLLFDGASHHIRLGLSGPDIDGAIEALRDALGHPELHVPGHAVIEIGIVAVDRGGDGALLSLDARTIEAAAIGFLP